MELELTRRCQRSVRVAEFVPMDATHTIKTGRSNEAAASSCKTPLFAGYVEALYARNAWLAVRVDIWTSSDICCRQVKWANAYLQEREEEVAMPLANGGAMANLQKVETIDLRMEDRGEIPALTGKELTNELEDVVKQVVDAFQVLQVQALQAATSPRAKFECEMLQHHPGLEVLVLNTQKDESFVLFALPLLGRKSQWNPDKLIEMENLDSAFLPDAFQAPNCSVSTDQVTIFIGYPLKEEEGGSEDTWPLLMEWPARMLLSSQVTQTPPSSKGQSSVELIASCKKMFLQQWRRRKDFVSELRRHVIVLEYDAVDFSQVFFMLQEQLNEQAPLRIIVLQLQFTAAFFLTNCMSDLQVTLLDGGEGEAPVTAALEASSTPSSPSSSADSVVQFLKSVQKSLIRHFYGEGA